MNLTNEQIEQILSKAPKKALTVDHDCKWYYLSESRSLSDLREILTLRQEVGRFKAERDSVCHLNNELSAELNQLREQGDGS